MGAEFPFRWLRLALLLGIGSAQVACTGTIWLPSQPSLPATPGTTPGDPNANVDPDSPPPPFSPAPLAFRVLVGTEYRSVITTLLGASSGAAVTPPPDSALYGFASVGASQMALSPTALA